MYRYNKMPYYCDVCTFICASQKKLDVHNRIHDPNIIAERTCTFCNMRFSSKYHRDKHSENCKSKTDPDALIRCIERQEQLLKQKDELIVQKDTLIEQQQTTIDQLKEVKPNTDVVVGDITTGNNSPVDASVNKTIDNSTTNNNDNSIHIHIETPYAFRTADMEFMINDLQQTDSDFQTLKSTIFKHAKRGDILSSIGSILTYLHDNTKLKKGHNIRYIKEGEFKGFLSMFEFNKDFTGGTWYIGDIVPISKIISNEVQTIRKIQDDENDKLPSHKKVVLTQKEQKNIEEFDEESRQLHIDIGLRDHIFKIIKTFKISDGPVPTINGTTISELLDTDDVLSNIAKEDKKTSKERYAQAKKDKMEAMSKKTREIMKKNNEEVKDMKQVPDAEYIRKQKKLEMEREDEEKKAEEKRILDEKFELEKEASDERFRKQEALELMTFKLPPIQIPSVKDIKTKSKKTKK